MKTVTITIAVSEEMHSITLNNGKESTTVSMERMSPSSWKGIQKAAVTQAACEALFPDVDADALETIVDNCSSAALDLHGELDACMFFEAEDEEEDSAVPDVETAPVVGRPRATELEWLEWFAENADFGPADGDVRANMKQRFMDETKKNLPEGWNYGSDGETIVDRE